MANEQARTPVIPNLPRSENLTYLPPTQPGIWTAYDDPETLRKVADGILSSHEQRSPHSIPDVWKRAAVFADVLRDASSTQLQARTALQRRMVAEWRGMLAILALWKVRQWNWVQVEPVALVRRDISTQQKLGFVEVLEKLQPSQPSEFILQNVTWKEFHILIGPKGKPFGFTSPMSLVCTAQDCTGRIQGIPWVIREEGQEFLSDPLTDDYLKSQEKLWLAQWLAGIRTQIQDQLPRSGGRHVPIVTLLQEYERAANDGQLAEPLTASEVSDAGLGISSAYTKLLYGPIDKPVGTVGYLENRIIVIKGKKAEVLPGAQIENVASNTDTPIPPIRKHLLKDFSSAELAKGLTMRSADKKIIVELKLDWNKSLSHPEQTGRIIETHEYGENDIIEIDPLNVPVVNIWPNFLHEQWDVYYTYISLTSRPELGVLRIRPMFDGQKTSDHEYFSKNGTGFAVYETPEFPQALICTYEYHNEETDRQDHITAVLPLQRPERLPESTRSDTDFVAGVDFGSTGSVIFLRAESVQSPDPNKLEKLKFKARLFKVAGGKTYEWRTDREFLPIEDPNPAVTPYSGQILSVYQMHTQPPRDDPPRPLSEGHVLYLKEYEKFIEPGTKRITANLKWGGNTEILLTESFLRQICLQTAAEAMEIGAKRITWRFSYPTAFAPDKVAAFKTKWERVAVFVKERTGVESNSTSHGEAVAAGRYFAQGGLDMSISTGALSIDIGGGTSDYSFWRDEKLKLHNSVLLAGRDIFLMPLRRRPEFLSQLDSELTKLSNQVKDLEKTDQNAANAQLDAIIARKGDDLRERLINHATERHVREFCALIETGLKGILYYGGLLLRYQIERKTFRPDKSKFGIYIGGNGSKLFHWAAGHTFTNASDCAPRLKEAFRAACGLDPKTDIEIGLSRMPKSEVACGLVLPAIVSDGEHASDLIACERFESGRSGSGAWHEWNTAPEKDDVLKNGIHVDPKLPEFSRFLATLGTILSDAQLKTLETRINNRLAALRAPMAHDQDGIAETIMRGEPVWIVAFKLFFEDQVNAWIQTSLAATAR